MKKETQEIRVNGAGEEQVLIPMIIDRDSIEEHGMIVGVSKSRIRKWRVGNRIVDVVLIPGTKARIRPDCVPTIALSLSREGQKPINTVNQETKQNYKTSPQKHINYFYYPSMGQSVAIIPYKTSYEKLSDSIKNKFPNEPLPKDGRIINYMLKAGNIKDISGLKRMDFVIDKNGKLIIGKKHQTLGNADDVLAAGQLKVDGDGMIRRIDNNSGHYRPTVEEALKYPELFEQAGFNLDKAWLYINKYTINYSEIIIKSENVVHKKISK